MIPKIPATITVMPETFGWGVEDSWVEDDDVVHTDTKLWETRKLDDNTYMVHAYFPKTRKLYIGLVDTTKWEKRDGD